MRSLIILLIWLLWFVGTLVLCLSLIGLIVIVCTSEWMSIGDKLIDKL